MNKLSILLLAAVIAPGIQAQSKMDISSRARLRAASHGIEFVNDAKGNASLHRAPARKNASVDAFIFISDESAIDRLAEAGATVASVRGNMVMASVPVSAIDAVNDIEGVERISLSKPVKAKMDIVRQVTGIDKIHSGEGLDAPYTGKGVLAGIIDGGFDPNHVNFKNEDGTSRIKRFTYYRPTQTGEYAEEIHDADYIPNIDTETDDTFHGTHTLGIMAGGYRGKLTAARPDKTGFQSENVEIDNPYYGVAYDSDIALAAGANSDYHMAMGIETILDYAYNHDRMPVVINMSLGTNVGPHDGSSVICQYMDYVTDHGQDNVLFCLSAGNEGDLPIVLHKTATEDDMTLATCFYPATNIPGYNNPRAGTTFIYSDTSEPFDVQVVIINKSRNKVAMRMPLAAVTETTSKYWVSSSSWASDESDEVSPQFARYFEGYVGIGAETDKENGRYYAVIDMTTWDNTSTNALGNYILGLEVVAKKAGQRIDVYGDGGFCNFSSYGLAGYEDGVTDGTISDIACGNTSIIVGSYNTRDDWACIDGGIYGYQGTFPAGKMTDFTSYGTLIDGRELPHVCAPGASIISSYNEYYADSNGNPLLADNTRNAVYNDGTRKHSWFQCVGTSMASPVVAGSLVLWKQADPSIDYKTVLDIIKQTAVSDNDVMTSGNPVQWGAGKFDAYAGLKEVIRRRDAGVEGIVVDKAQGLVINRSGDIYTAFLEGVSDFTLSLHSATGALAGKYEATDGEASFDASHHAAGVYILSVDGHSDIPAKRILVK